jgi:hypothetical protein
MHGRRTRTHAIPAAGIGRRRPKPRDDPPVVELPAEHVIGHAELLPDAPTTAEVAGWLDQVEECVRLRWPLP